ncbi:hypothetical protein CDO73_22370 [Saccharibacillus sp. O23]|uniref:M50 family metallopeptidase n=1 Tax=Saccharibacillus sp. O23 TaxID=2009338 RepID=UPI000B4E1F38|nr:M50 family metallopeptidase [Saccharibacillus sp. O23]OWR27369.1 hypothetical protein CDO73_22370 [Saccharibacillus sp. O23]
MFKKIMPLLIGAAAGGAAAWAAVELSVNRRAGASLTDRIGEGIPAVSGFGPAVLLILGLALLVMFTILLHEFGHMLGAVVVGSRITRLYWGPWIFLFPERRVRFDFRSKFFFGAMQCEIRPYADDASFARAIRAQRIVYGAGPAFSLATGAAAWILAPGLWSIAGGYGLISVGIGLATLVSDGAAAVMLGKRNFALVTAWSLLIQEARLDEKRRAFLTEASLRYLAEAAASAPASSQGSNKGAKGRDLYDLYLLYYVKLMREEHEVSEPEIALTEEAAAERSREGKLAKMRRDALDMALSEEVVRLCESGEREAAEELYAKIGGSQSKRSPLLLKARAYIERSEEAIREYEASVDALSSDAASFGALRQLDRKRLQQAGLA